MNNKEISAIFLRIADILEIKGENVFRIRAYRTAAQNIGGLSRQLSDIYEEDPKIIGNIPGIGKDLKEKIIEMIERGSLRYYKELQKEFPQGFIDMLNLSGMGPKKLKKLREELEIENVDDLEKACQKGELESLEGMGVKTQEKLLDAIAHFRQSEGRMLLPEADMIAEEIISYLKKNNKFKKIEKAGSLRRGKETIGDIDILAVSGDPEAAMDYFVAYPGVEDVIAKGSTKTSISLEGGPQVDLRIIDKASFGAALVYFTGSKEHNVRIRKIAKSKKLKINEYGVFSGKTGKKEKFIAGKTEEEVYKSLDMQWIPPEVREGTGEIEAARQGIEFDKLVSLRHIKGDLHMHTDTTDGRDSLENMVKTAEEKGYKYIAITNHTKNVKIAGGLDEKELLKHVEDIRKFSAKRKGIKILAGAEVDILKSGKLDMEDSVLKELDIVIIAVHSHFSLDKEEQTKRILKAMDNKYVNVLAHPSGRLISSRNPIDLDFEKVFRKAVSANIYLEINTHGDRIDLNAVNCKRAKELGAKFVINTDAHAATQLSGMKYGVVTARRGWLEKGDILNTYTYDKMIKEL